MRIGHQQFSDYEERYTRKTHGECPSCPLQIFTLRRLRLAAGLAPKVVPYQTQGQKPVAPLKTTTET